MLFFIYIHIASIISLFFVNKYNITGVLQNDIIAFIQYRKYKYF